MIIFGCLFAPIVLNAQVFTEDFKSLPISYANGSGEGYGTSVSIDGDYAVIGAPGYKGNQGCAYVLQYTSNSWETIALLTASDGYENNLFGTSVGISGDVIVIGAPSDHNGTGSAYVFKKPANGWINMNQTGKLIPSGQTDLAYYGRSVDIC